LLGVLFPDIKIPYFVLIRNLMYIEVPILNLFPFAQKQSFGVRYLIFFGKIYKQKELAGAGAPASSKQQTN